MRLLRDHVGQGIPELDWGPLRADAGPGPKAPEWQRALRGGWSRRTVCEVYGDPSGLCQACAGLEGTRYVEAQQ